MKGNVYRGPERRKNLRKESNLEVDFTLLGDKKKSEYTLDKTTTANLGGEGLCIYSKGPLPIGAKVLVMIDIPHCRDLTVATTKVIWSKQLRGDTKYRIGLQYLMVKEEDRKKINEYIRR